VARYRTTDAVELAPADISGASLENYTDLGFDMNYKPSLRKLLADLGVSDRVVRYRADSSQISLEQR
jgi:hypothetical protein